MVGCCVIIVDWFLLVGVGANGGEFSYLHKFETNNLFNFNWYFCFPKTDGENFKNLRIIFEVRDVWVHDVIRQLQTGGDGEFALQEVSKPVRKQERTIEEERRKIIVDIKKK